MNRPNELYSTPSGHGGSFTVSIVEDLGDERVMVRVWYGRQTTQGWESWPDWDGYTFPTKRSELTPERWA